MDNNTVSIKISFNDVNVILHALSLRPYAEVHFLLENIKKQAEDKIEENKVNSEARY